MTKLQLGANPISGAMSSVAGSTANGLNDLYDSASTEQSTGFSILVVDDSFVSLRGMARVLRKKWETDVASSADEALYMIRRNGYAVVISDCDMPGKDGIWLLQQTQELSPDTVRVLASAGERERFTSHIKSGLIQCFLTKPVVSEQLCEFIQKMML